MLWASGEIPTGPCYQANPLPVTVSVAPCGTEPAPVVSPQREVEGRVLRAGPSWPPPLCSVPGPVHAHPGLQPCLGRVGPACCCLCPCSVAPTAGPWPRTNSLLSECPYESPQQEGLGTQVCADPQQLWCPPWSKAPPPAAAWRRACSAQGFPRTGPGDTACSNLGDERAPSQLCHTPRVPMAPGPALLLRHGCRRPRPAWSRTQRCKELCVAQSGVRNVCISH